MVYSKVVNRSQKEMKKKIYTSSLPYMEMGLGHRVTCGESAFGTKTISPSRVSGTIPRIEINSKRIIKGARN